MNKPYKSGHLNLGSIVTWCAMILGGMCIAVCLTASLSAVVPDEDIKLFHMWVRLAINGFAEPMPVYVPGK